MNWGLLSSIASGIILVMGSERKAKVRENRLRRMADRQGLTLVRSRRRDPLAIDYGLYWLKRGAALLTAVDGVTVDEIEERLTSPPPQNTPPPAG